MADQPARLPHRIASALPFVLPVLGGLLGVVYVNMSPKELLNPFFAVVIGVVIGRIVAVLVVRAIGNFFE